MKVKQMRSQRSWFLLNDTLMGCLWFFTAFTNAVHRMFQGCLQGDIDFYFLYADISDHSIDSDLNPILFVHKIRLETFADCF